MMYTRSYMKSVKKIIAVVLACMAVFLCSCSTTSTTKIKSKESDMAQASQVIEEVVKKPGGDLFISMPKEIESFDPLKAKNEDLINLLSLIYETPLKYDVNGKLLPNLFESWKVNEDKTEYTFTLRDNVFYSDGTTKLTVDDIIYSAKRAMALDGFAVNVNSGESENTEEDKAVDEATTDVENSAPATGDTKDFKSRFGQFSQYVESISAPDEHTVVLKMNKKGNMGLHFMTFPVVNETLIKDELPVGTGMYKVDVAQYKPAEEMILTRNENWWQPKPYIEKIVAKATQNYSTELEFVEASIIDFATTDALYSGKYRQPGKTQVIDYMTNYYDCLVPNLITNELKDVNVRQAISYALDRREILSTVLLNHGIPTNLPIAPDFFAYDSKYKISDFDSSMAKELLQESGYVTEPSGKGRKLNLNLIVLDERNGAYKKEAAKAIKKQLEELYIEIEIEELPMDEYMRRLEGGNFDLAYCSYYLDIVPNLSFMFDHGGSGNYGHVQNEDITNAIYGCTQAVTDEDVMGSYGELQRVLTERVPQIGLYFRMNSIICDESIKDVKGVRQNMIFSTLAEWYNAYFAGVVQKNIAEAGAQSTQMPAPEATSQPAEQTETPEQTTPEAPETIAETEPLD